MKKVNGNSWNVKACNRLCEERNADRRHDKHLEALSAMRSRVDQTSPPDQHHLRTKLKTKKLQEDRAAEIQLENRILLQKMLNIDTKPSAVSGDMLMSRRIPPRTMNGECQRRELDRITMANQDMLKRLQTARPSVDPRSWEIEEEDRQALKFRLSQNSCRARAVSLKLPRKGVGIGSRELPRLIGGPQSARFHDDDWGRLTNNELDNKLREIEYTSSAPATARAPGVGGGTPPNDGGYRDPSGRDGEIEYPNDGGYTDPYGRDG